MNRPIFVVGAPRSGTSILTWCLGQHSNILAQEESDWLGRFSLEVESAYQIGSRRGQRSQFGALGVQRTDFFASYGSTINQLILRHRHELTRIAREQALADPHSPQILPGFQTERSQSDPKQRWVDGTPEYSFYICSLRKLFPAALFIHVLRDVDSVVRSLLHFSSGNDEPLVRNESEAYDYWLRAVRACARAERAYGPALVHRLPYSQVVREPEVAFRSLFRFLGENFEPACLEPLQNRINSSHVPPDFSPGGSAANASIIEEARRLEPELATNIPSAPDSDAERELEAELQQRVNHNLNVNTYYRKALLQIEKLKKEIAELRGPSPQAQPRWKRWLAGAH